TYNHLDFKVSCGWNTAKVIYAVTQPSYISTSLTPAVWNAMSQENKEARLLSVYQGIPEKYKSGMKGSYSCNANSTCIVYAIPIDKDGKIGKMDIKTINTGAVPVTGKGDFTGMTAVPQTTWDSYSFNVQVDANTVAYRLMWFTETDEKNSEYISRINEIFFDTKYQEYGMWKEYNAEETSVDMGIYRPGDNYYLYGATVDRFGNISTPVNLGEKYLGTKLISTMKKTVDEE
ncbi:MAG: hypothetical protein HUK03_03860, partial [Bacteroidaceae bacterium]|nr:hypothetical protein [Bacteroidaceae bacterium]